eukprot:462060_1
MPELIIKEHINYLRDQLHLYDITNDNVPKHINKILNVCLNDKRRIMGNMIYAMTNVTIDYADDIYINTNDIDNVNSNKDTQRNEPTKTSSDLDCNDNDDDSDNDMENILKEYKMNLLDIFYCFADCGLYYDNSMKKK